MLWPWGLLGLPYGASRAAIRSAYAAKLRETHPEDDPEGFKALRDAYEAALRSLVDPAAGQVYDPPPHLFGTTDVGHRAEGWDGPEGARDAEAIASSTETGAPRPAADAERRTPNEPAPEISTERRGFDLLCRDLLIALEGPWGANRAALEQQFDAIMRHRALDEIALRTDLERWAAALIVQHLPRSDPLIEPAIRAFGWERPASRDPGPLAAIFRRLDEWRFVNQHSEPGSPGHASWTSLIRPPRRGWGMRLSALRPGVPKGVADILALAEGPLPGISDWFDTGALDWWRRYFSRPRLKATNLLLVPAVFVVLLLAVDGAAGDAEVPDSFVYVSLLLSLAAPLVFARVLEPVRYRLADTEGYGDGLDVTREGWMPILGVLPVVSFALAPFEWGWAPVAMLSAVIVIWIWLSAPPRHPRSGGGTIALGFWLSLFLLPAALGALPRGLSLAGLLSILAAWMAWSVGVERLDAQLYRMRPDARLGILIGAAASLLALAAWVAPKLLHGSAALGVAVPTVAICLLLAALARRTLGLRGWAYAPIVAIWVAAGVVLSLARDGATSSGANSLPLPNTVIQSCPEDRNPAGPRPATLCGSANSLATSTDYPERARAYSASGSNLVIVSVGGDGFARDCEVRVNSGSGLLDDRACEIVRERARFLPALDASGQTISGVSGFRFEWDATEPRITVAQLSFEALNEYGVREEARLPVRCLADLRQPKDRAPAFCGPPAALLAAAELPVAATGTAGVTELRLAVDAEGRVADCRIERQSGEPEVDRSFCPLITARARLHPARWSDARLARSELSLTVEWRGPSESALARIVVEPGREATVLAPPPVPSVPSTVQPPLGPPMKCSATTPEAPGRRAAELCEPIDAAWFGPASYSAAALAAPGARDGEFSIFVSAAGRVTGCEVRMSTGTPRLDRETCALLTARLRFRSATDNDGSPISGSFTFRLQRD